MQKDSKEKKFKIVYPLIVVAIIVIPILLGLYYKYEHYIIKTPGVKNDTWITFVSSYLSAIGSITLGLVSYNANKKMNEANIGLIKLQEKLLNLQSIEYYPQLKLVLEKSTIIHSFPPKEKELDEKCWVSKSFSPIMKDNEIIPGKKINAYNIICVKKNNEGNYCLQLTGNLHLKFNSRFICNKIEVESTNLRIAQGTNRSLIDFNNGPSILENSFNEFNIFPVQIANDDEFKLNLDIRLYDDDITLDNIAKYMLVGSVTLKLHLMNNEKYNCVINVASYPRKAMDAQSLESLEGFNYEDTIRVYDFSIDVNEDKEKSL